MVWGVIIALVIVGVLLFVLVRIKQNASCTVMSWMVVIIMVFAISVATNRLIMNIEDYSHADDYITSVYDCIEACLPFDLGFHRLSFEESHLVAVALKSEMPEMSKYIRVSDLEGNTVESIADTLRGVLRKDVMRSVWNLVGWIALTLVVGTVFLTMTLDVGKSSKKSSTPPSWKNDIDF